MHGYGHHVVGPCMAMAICSFPKKPGPLRGECARQVAKRLGRTPWHRCVVKVVQHANALSHPAARHTAVTAHGCWVQSTCVPYSWQLVCSLATHPAIQLTHCKGKGVTAIHIAFVSLKQQTLHILNAATHAHCLFQHTGIHVTYQGTVLYE